MKGSLHTGELTAAVVRKDTGLRTERRISHVFMMDVPTSSGPITPTHFPTLGFAHIDADQGPGISDGKIHAVLSNLEPTEIEQAQHRSPTFMSTSKGVAHFLSRMDTEASPVSDIATRYSGHPPNHLIR